MKRVSFLIVAALVFALLIPFGAAMAVNEPSASPSYSPSVSPSYSPSVSPSYSPSVSPSYSPSATPTPNPSNNLAPAGTPGLSSGVPTGSELVGDETPRCTAADRRQQHELALGCGSCRCRLCRGSRGNAPQGKLIFDHERVRFFAPFSFCCGAGKCFVLQYKKTEV